MSSIERKGCPEVFPQPVFVEHRSKVRFPLELPVRYRSLGRRHPFAGNGWVVNISSGGVLVACQHEIRAGTLVDLSVDWPSPLDGRIPLRLVIAGKVVRSGASSFAVVSTGYQFRTARRPVISISEPSSGDTARQTAKRAASA
jgi:hypothetical protein